MTSHDNRRSKPDGRDAGAVDVATPAPLHLERPGRILPSIPPPPGALSRLKGLRLLAVDDDPAKLDALAMSLRDRGAKVAVGDRGGSGLRQAIRFVPDAIISDVVSPGSPGWMFIERLRHHPVLQWTPVLLNRWWESTGPGEGRVLLDRLTDRLEELLAPGRVLAERIDSGRTLGERIEMTGPVILLRLLSGGRLDGRVTVNDAWSVFEISLRGERILAAARRGLSGDQDSGETALLQLLLCDAGRWTLRPSEDSTEETEGVPIQEALATGARQISALFGPDPVPLSELERRLLVNEELLEAVASTLAPMERELLAEIESSRDPDSVVASLAGTAGCRSLDPVLKSLVRSGAVRLRPAEDIGIPTRMARKFAQLLEALAEQGPAVLGSPDEDTSSVTEPIRAGSYAIRDIRTEHVEGARTTRYNMPDNTPTPDPLETTETKPLGGEPPRGPAGERALDDTPLEQTPPASSLKATLPASPAVGMPRQQPASQFDLRGLVHESLAPGPRDRVAPPRTQMWLGIGLAVLLGALLTAAIVLFAGD